MKAISVKTIKEKKFKLIELDEYWSEHFGTPERNFKALFHGPSGSGKSTYVLRFCDYLAKNMGKVLYNSYEEGISSFLQQRIIEHGIDASKLYFYDRMPFEAFCEKMKKGRYTVGVIDSLQYMNLTYSQYKELVRRFPTKAFIFISQTNNRGTTKGGTDILHAVDIKVKVVMGKASIQSRFGKGHKEIQLFSTKRKNQLTIF